MTRSTLSLILITAASFTGCGDDDDALDPGFLPGETSGVAWSADIAGIGGFAAIQGQAEVMTTADLTSFMAGAEILFDEPFVDRAWHVHFNSCATGGDIVGPPEAYPPLMTNEDGTDAVNIVVAERLDPAGQYHVNVHLSPAELEVIIACGDLVLH